MKIPLDYYRILGLPIQATAEQLQQAHRDRTLQLPRREYSQAAIQARKALLDEAYEVLSTPSKRQTYDAAFLSDAYDLDIPSNADESSSGVNGNGDPAVDQRSIAEALTQFSTGSSPSNLDPYTPTVEIQDDQFVGALLILLELGEYELVLRLGRPFLSSGSLSLDDGRYGDPTIVLADIVLTIAIACLELGREQWQQGQYEHAAESLETGQDLLLNEGVFPALRGEIQADLFKLRPYRILELLSLSEMSANYTVEHRKGLALLQDMIQERSGIDGAGDDQSGLSIDDFLRFIQQLRSYLTTDEQQVLFEEEARRPSAVAVYLAVYALIARGFAQREPALIRRAKLMLLRLGTRQDMYLEQSICALLLGQTEEANRALELSHEYDSLAFIQEHSHESPDLLPGLCLYAERWLQHEVFPHFRDLVHQQASLKDYFADEQVQAYLEELPNEPVAHNWSGSAAQSATLHTENSSNGHHDTSVGSTRSQTAESSYGASSSHRGGTATATLETQSGHLGDNGASTMPAAERISQPPSNGHNGHNGAKNMKSGVNGATMPREGVPNSPDALRRKVDRKAAPSPTGKPVATSLNRAPRGRQLRIDRLLFLVAIGFVGIIGLGTAITRISQAFLAEEESASITELGSVNEFRAIASEWVATQQPSSAITQTALNETVAQDIVASWLNAKAQALGSTYEIAALEQILANPVLGQQQARSQELQQTGQYWQYQHEIDDVELVFDEETPNIATIQAVVREVAELYDADTEEVVDGYDSTVQVEYDLTRQDGQWRIERMVTF